MQASGIRRRHPVALTVAIDQMTVPNERYVDSREIENTKRKSENRRPPTLNGMATCAQL